MVNAQFLMYGSKHLGQNLFFYVFLNTEVILGLLSTAWYSVVSMKNQYNLKIKCVSKPECDQNLNFHEAAQCTTDVGKAGLLSMHD